MNTHLTQEPVAAKNVIVGNFHVDEAIIAVLPPGVKVISADSFGSSAWSVTARIVAEGVDGTSIRYFLKCTTGESGKSQLEGEFHAMSELYKTLPTSVPKPHAWGKLTVKSPPTYFFLCDFLNISDRLPDPAIVGARLAELHQRSISPTGNFGFHVPTYDGKLPQAVNWNSSWPSCFSKLLVGISELDSEVNGPWKELQDVLDQVVSHVIPRLLGALELEGRVVKPCLIHGDLWEGNIGTDIETGNIFIFDSCAYYAHNEMEIGMWRVEHHRMKAKAYKREYLRRVEISEPVEEFDDRNRLYSVKTKLMYSAHVPGTSVRNQAHEDLYYLVKKYGRGSNGSSASTEPTESQGELLLNILKEGELKVFRGFQDISKRTEPSESQEVQGFSERTDAKISDVPGPADGLNLSGCQSSSEPTEVSSTQAATKNTEATVLQEISKQMEAIDLYENLSEISSTVPQGPARRI